MKIFKFMQNWMSGDVFIAVHFIMVMAIVFIIYLQVSHLRIHRDFRPIELEISRLTAKTVYYVKFNLKNNSSYSIRVDDTSRMIEEWIKENKIEKI